MILYRALIDDDLKEFLKTCKISCTLKRSYDDLKKCKNIQLTKKMYDICYNQQNKKDICSFIYGHVNGKLVASAKRSPWISLTSDFNAAYKYATLQKCVETTGRRHILCFEVDDNNIINNSKDFKTKNIINGAIVNLSDGNLANYRKDGIIVPYGDNQNKKRSGDNFTLTNYSKGDKEYLICYELKPDNYILLNPEQQDNLLTTYGDKINNNISKMLINQKVKEK